MFKIQRKSFIKRSLLSMIEFCPRFQARPRGDRGQRQHEGRHSHRQGPLRRPGPAEVAVRRLVERRHPSELHGGRWITWVSCL
jgi:hypothetical protein